MYKLAVTTSQPTLVSRAKQWALQLGVPYLPHLVGGVDCVLVVQIDRLLLREVASGVQISVDFLEGQAAYRVHSACRAESHLLARSVGLHKRRGLSILDATAGLGRDGVLLARLGGHLTLVERHPVIFALLDDGLRRAAQAPWFKAMTIQWRHAQSLDFLEGAKTYDVIYLDPMFPARRKTARVKKDMHMLGALLGPDSDIEPLFLLALKRAKMRVVVKRPRLSGPIIERGPKVDVTFQGKRCRFDVYLCH